MTDEEFDIIDEIYFVTSYRDLKEASGLDDEILKSSLVSMVKKGWVRTYRNVNESSEISKIDLEENFRDYFYLASKKGLFEHNTR